MYCVLLPLHDEELRMIHIRGFTLPNFSHFAYLSACRDIRYVL